jgi:hypothetical protein
MAILLPGGGTPSWANLLNFSSPSYLNAGTDVPPPPPPPPGVEAPDYNQLLANNPYVLQAQAMAAAQMAALRSQIGQSASRALINLGDTGIAKGVDNLFLDKDIEGKVAEANTAGTSVLSQLGHQHDQNVQAIPANLAGRGFYRSGQLGYGLGEEGRSYGLQQEKVRSQTLDYLDQLANQYLTGQFQAQQAENSALMQAYNQAQSMMAYYANAAQGTGQGTGIPIGADAHPELAYGKLRLALGNYGGRAGPWVNS